MLLSLLIPPWPPNPAFAASWQSPSLQWSWRSRLGWWPVFLLVWAEHSPVQEANQAAGMTAGLCSFGSEGMDSRGDGLLG